MTGAEAKSIVSYIDAAMAREGAFNDKCRTEAVGNSDGDMCIYLRGYIEGYKKAMELMKGTVELQCELSKDE